MASVDASWSAAAAFQRYSIMWMRSTTIVTSTSTRSRYASASRIWSSLPSTRVTQASFRPGSRAFASSIGHAASGGDERFDFIILAYGRPVETELHIRHSYRYSLRGDTDG